MTWVRHILFWSLLIFISAEAQSAARCFEQMIGGPDEACHHGPLKSTMSMRQVICDFKLECPEHNQAIEWQEVPSVAQAVANFSLTGASSEDLARWHMLRAKLYLFSGQYASAVDESDDALLLLLAPADQVLSWYALYFKGIALKHLYRYEEASSVLGEALNTAIHINDERYRLYVLHAISELMTIKEQHGEARLNTIGSFIAYINY